MKNILDFVLTSSMLQSESQTGPANKFWGWMVYTLPLLSLPPTSQTKNTKKVYDDEGCLLAGGAVGSMNKGWLKATPKGN